MPHGGNRVDPVSTDMKKRRFAQEFIVDCDPGNAVERSPYKTSSRKSSVARGCQLLKDAKVQEYIKEEIEAQKKRLELDQDRVLREQMRIAFSDYNSYMNWDQNGTQWKDSKDLTEDQTRAIESVEFIENVSEYSANKRMKIKLYNKNVALDALSRHLGLYEKDNKRTIADETSEVNGLSGLLKYDANNSTE